MSGRWSEVLTAGDLLVRATENAPSRTALAMPALEIPYSELEARVLTLARSLISLGVRRGDNVGIFAPNSPEFVEAFFAVVTLGAVAIPLNVRYKSAELAHVIRDADLKVLLTTDRVDERVSLSGLIGEAVPELSGKLDPRALRVSDAPHLSAVAMLRGGNDQIQLLSRDDLDGIASGASVPEVERMRREVRIRDLAVILYTSGTTSRPKGCMLTHEAMTRGPADRAIGRFATENEAEAYWLPGPLFHVAALSPLLGCVAAVGTCITDIHFDPGRAIGLMRDHEVTVAFPWFPPVTEPLIDHPDFVPEALGALRIWGQIGPRALLERLDALLPKAELVKVSGMTECGGWFAISEPEEDLETRIETQGRPIPGVEVRIVEPEGEAEMPSGVPGELLIRGFLIIDGYYKDEARTAAALDSRGWLRTGDSYSLTSSGSLVFHGRLKDMLKVGGENVAPMEVEEFLLTHPAVQKAEVVGMPDSRLDEVPVAFVELREGAAADETELIGFCEGRIASYKVPRAIRFIEASVWPMSATKVDKGALRRLLD